MPAMSNFGGRRPRAADLVPRPYTYTQSTSNTEPDILPDADITEGLLSEALQVLSLPTINEGDVSSVELRNFKYIGSYNWLDNPHPTILVPGSPPIWRDRSLPFRVPFDEGFQVFDPNGYHMGSSASSPLIPLFRAVDTVAEDNADTTMDWPAVDLVADRSSLRGLLRWVRASDSKTQPTPDFPGMHPKRKPPDFRIDLQLGGVKTVLMQRWDKHTCQYSIPPLHGCRLNFDKAVTTPAPGCSEGSSHFRIVQYDLEGLQPVVRFEVDAHIFATASDPTTDIDDLSERLAGLSTACRMLAPKSSSPIPPPTLPSSDYPELDSVVAVVRGGAQIPQSSIIEISTNSTKHAANKKWEEVYTGLFLSQTPLHIVATHQRGSFESVTKRPLNSPEFRRVAAKDGVQRNLKQLAALLREIQTLVKEHGRRGRLSLVCRAGRLELFDRSDGNDVGCLDDGELARFGI